MPEYAGSPGLTASIENKLTSFYREEFKELGSVSALQADMDMVAWALTSLPGRQRQTDPWSSLAGHSSQHGEFQDGERHYTENEN